MSKNKKPEGPAGPSMKEVALAAGVAVSTVSRALATPGRVNEKTRKRVQSAAKRLGYTPNAAARSLRLGRSKVVMIVLPGQLFHGASQIIPLVLAGIDDRLSRQGYNILISNLDRQDATERHILELAGSGSVDGAVVLSSGLPAVEGRTLADTGLPVVALLHDLSDSDVPSVITNDRQVMTQVAEGLIAQGHRKFFYVAGLDGMYHERQRFAGIRDATDRAGFGAEALLKSAGDKPYEEGFSIGIEAADMFAALPDRPTAVLCCSDDAALSFISRLKALGISVPHDVSVVGFDGAAVGAFFDPSLSTIAQPVREMGEAAAELLLTKLQGEDVPLVTTLNSQFVPRDSAPSEIGANALPAED